MYKIGKHQRRLLLFLMGGVGLGLSANPRQYYKMLSAMKEEWDNINQTEIRRSARILITRKLLKEKVLPNGSFCLELTHEGKREAKRLSLVGKKIHFRRKKHWDKRWRVVIFDIPEEKREFRDILRIHLYEAGFYKLQQSVFISPHPYEKQIQQLVELYGAQKHVFVITAIYIDHSDRLLAHFFPSKSQKEEK